MCSALATGWDEREESVDMKSKASFTVEVEKFVEYWSPLFVLRMQIIQNGTLLQPAMSGDCEGPRIEMELN